MGLQTVQVLIRQLTIELSGNGFARARTMCLGKLHLAPLMF
jgi:hypothetical protein